MKHSKIFSVVLALLLVIVAVSPGFTQSPTYAEALDTTPADDLPAIVEPTDAPAPVEPAEPSEEAPPAETDLPEETEEPTETEAPSEAEEPAEEQGEIEEPAEEQGETEEPAEELDETEESTEDELGLLMDEPLLDGEETIDSIFPDPAVAKGVADRLRKQPTDTVTQDELNKMLGLDLSNTSASDLTGVERLPGLSFVMLSDTAISDLTPLSGAAYLSTLDIQNTKVTSLEPLRNASNLNSLSATGLNISSLEPLRDKAKLMSLGVGGTQSLTSLDPLRTLPKLSSLRVINAGISDLSPLSGLSNLTNLTLQYCPNLSDLSPLSGMTQLKTLWLNCCNIYDVSPLSGLSNITDLQVPCNHIIDFTPLAQGWVNSGIRLDTRLQTITRPTIVGLNGILTYEPSADFRYIDGSTAIKYSDTDGGTENGDGSITWDKENDFSGTLKIRYFDEDATYGSTAYRYDVAVTMPYRMTFSVDFHSEFGEPMPQQIVDAEDMATEPTALAEPHYVFEGWYTEESFENPYDFSTPVVHKTDLYAKWSPVMYTITYTDGVDSEAVFEDQVSTAKYDDDTPAFVGTPEREGYTFLGWDPAIAEKVSGNATYTAQWEPIAIPSQEPTEEPTEEPTQEPTEEPTEQPTAKPTATPKSSDVPETGDRSNMGLYTALIIAMATGIILLAVRRRRA